jgi:hypothetical protein
MEKLRCGWILGMMKSTLLDAGYFYSYINIVELHSEKQLNCLQTLWSFQILSLYSVRQYQSCI